jgi:hypothetical protein
MSEILLFVLKIFSWLYSSVGAGAGGKREGGKRGRGVGEGEMSMLTTCRTAKYIAGNPDLYEPMHQSS